MTELSRYLFLAGAVPYLVLGLAHALHTPLRREDRRGLSPRDPAVGDAMAATTPLITRRTDLWLAWVGFNFSHSLGVVLFGLVVVLVGRSSASYAANAAAFQPLAIAGAAAYLLLAVRYWFRGPIAGCLSALAAFVLAAAMR